MKTRTIRCVVLAVAVVFLAGTALAAEGEGAEKAPGQEAGKGRDAEGQVFQGTGRSRNADEKAARDEAIIAAKVDALEKALERLLVHEKPRLREVVERYVAENLAPDQCFARTEVKQEERTGSTTKLTLEAALNQTVPDTVTKIREQFEKRGYPLVMVVLYEEVVQPAHLPPFPSGGMTAQIAIEKALIKEGATVVDGAMVDDNDRKAIESAVLKGDMDAVARLTLKHRANVLIGGPPARADHRGTVPMGMGQWPRYGATIQARIVDSDVGQVLGAQDGAGSGTGETVIPAVQNAFRDAGTKVARELIRDIFWHWFGPDRFNVRVSLVGVPHDKALGYAEALVDEEAWAVRRGTVEMREGECTFVLTVVDPATSAMVADALGLMDRKLKVTLVTARRVALQKPEE